MLSAKPCIEQSLKLARRTANKLPGINDRNWPGRDKAEFKLVAVNQSSKAGQAGKF